MLDVGECVTLTMEKSFVRDLLATHRMNRSSADSEISSVSLAQFVNSENHLHFDHRAIVYSCATSSLVPRLVANDI
jgi:hypothetical protein